MGRLIGVEKRKVSRGNGVRCPAWVKDMKSRLSDVLA